MLRGDFDQVDDDVRALDANALLDATCHGRIEGALERHVPASSGATSVALLTGLSRDLLYDELRRGNLHYRKVGRRRLITRQHLEQFLGIASVPHQSSVSGTRTGPDVP